MNEEASFYFLSAAASLGLITPPRFSPDTVLNNVNFEYKGKTLNFRGAYPADKAVNAICSGFRSEDLQRIKTLCDSMIEAAKGTKLLVYPPGFLVHSVPTILSYFTLRELMDFVYEFDKKKKIYCRWHKELRCYEFEYQSHLKTYYLRSPTKLNGFFNLLMQVWSKEWESNKKEWIEIISLQHWNGLVVTCEAKTWVPDFSEYEPRDCLHFLFLARTFGEVDNAKSCENPVKYCSEFAASLDAVSRKAWYEMIQLSIERADALKGPTIIRS